MTLFNFNDPNGMDVFGINFGVNVNLKVPKTPIAISGSIGVTAAFDTNFDTALVVTPELGGALALESGVSGFIRGVVGPDANTTVGDLLGPGTSVSGNVKGISGSITFPGEIDNLGVEAPIFEFGLGAGSPSLSVTQSHGFTVPEVLDAAKQGGEFLKDTFDAIRSFSNEASSAYGGFVLYPSKPNTNQLQSVYNK